MSTTLWSFGIWSKLERWKSLISGCHTNLKNHHFEVSSSLIPCNNNEQFLDWFVTWDKKVDFIWQSLMTSSVAGPRSSEVLPKTKLVPQKDHGHCLVVCCLSDSLQLSGSWQNHYIWEVCLANWWDTLKTAKLVANIDQCNGPNSSPWKHPTIGHTTNSSKSWTNRATKFCLICHVHLASRQPSTTSLSISVTFCRENAFTTTRR